MIIEGAGWLGENTGTSREGTRKCCLKKYVTWAGAVLRTC